MLLVLGVRSPAPFTPGSGTLARIPVSSRSRSVSDELDSIPSVARAMAAAFPIATAPGNVFGARTPLAFVLAAKLDGPQLGPLLHVQRADTLGSIKLVAADGIEIDPERFDIDRNFARRLHAVGMHQGSSFVRDLPRSQRSAARRPFRCWRASPRQEPSRVAVSGECRRGQWHPSGARPNIGDRDAHTLEFPAGIQHCRMLDGSGDRRAGRPGCRLR